MRVSGQNQNMINTFSMKTFVLLHFEHKNDVRITVKLCMELRAEGKKLCEV